MTLLKLIKLFVLRNIREEKFLTSLSVVGIALGIGLFIGVKVASDRAVASFEADLRGSAGNSNYEIFDISGIDFDEKIYAKVGALVENSFPVLRANGYLPERKETVTIEGIYVVKALKSISPNPKGGYDPEKFYREENGVLITRTFSKTHFLKEGDSLSPLVYERRYPLRVAGILDEALLPPNALIMDLGNFQEYFGKTGYLSRIDLAADEEKAEEIRRFLPSNLLIERKEEVIRNRQSVLKSFRYNLQFVSLIAILVGVFLLYNTVFISVVKRRSEIGILRGLGTERRTVILLFLIQGLMLGFAGSLLGVALGQCAAYFSVLAVEKTISTMYTALTLSDYFITKAEAFLAIVIGIGVSLIASAIPALEASRIRPNESIREGSFEGRYRRYLKLFSLAGLLCIVAGGVISYVDYRSMPFEFPFLAYFGILLIIAGFTFLSPSYLSALLRGSRGTTGRIFRATGKVAVSDMAGNLYRFSVALMSVAISSALIIALFTLIFSFRSSLKQWIQKNISADVYIKPASCASNFCFYPLPEEVIKTVEAMPGVAGMDKFRALSLDFRGRKVVAGFGEREARERSSGDERRAGKGVRESSGEIGISRYLSIKYGLKKGDSVELPTPKGSKRFVIGDVFSSYFTTSGFIYLDRKRLREYWGLDDATQIGILVQKGVDVDGFIRQLRGRLSERYSLEIMNNNELRQKVLTIFDRTFAITYAIELISILVSLIGVVNTLLALVLERKREISIMRYLGGTWKQIQEFLLITAGIVGVSGIAWGAVLGSLMSFIFIDVVNTVSFGWEIQFRVPVLYLSLVMVLLFFTTTAAGLLPARVAIRIDPKRFISFE